MPIYKFKNTETGEEYEKIMSISARETYLQENPHIQSMIAGAPAIGDAVRLGRKDLGGFKDVLSRIKANNRGSTIDI